MGRRGRTGPGGAVVSSLSDKSGGVVRPAGARPGASTAHAHANASSASSAASAASAGRPAADSNAPRTAPPPPVSSGWVGKQPSTFVREWCTKNARRKPLFRDIRAQPGFVRCVIPQGTKKPKEQVELVAVGDRPGMEWAALSMLHLVEKGRQMHRILPPDFADHWHKMEARQEAETRASDRAAFQQAKQQRRVKAAAKKEVTDSNCDEVVLSAETRTAIENVLLSLTSEINAPSAPIASNAVGDLLQLGFNEADARVALGTSNNHIDSITAAIDYLCLNLQEDELPPQFAPKADVEVVAHSEESGTGFDWKLVVRLADTFATSRSTAQRALTRAAGNDQVAAMNLYRSVVFQGAPEVSSETVSPPSDEHQTYQADELEALQAIYGADQVAGGTDLEGLSGWTISVLLKNIRCLGGRDAVLVLLDADKNYPVSVPIAFLKSAPNAPKIEPPLRRAIIRAIAAEANEARKDMEGEPMPLAHHIVAYLSDLTSKKLAKEGSIRPRHPSCVDSEPEAVSHQQTGPGARRSHTKKLKFQRGPGTVVRPLDLNKIDPRMKIGRLGLPAWKSKSEIQGAIRNNSVVVICGETGSGKTTQVPQYILDDESRTGSIQIICTQPRRLAAIAVAERVANERGQKVGGTVGYQVKLDSKTSNDTALTFCTTGVLLRKIQHDNTMQSATHIIVDEVHERSIETDFLLVLLRRVIEKRKDLRIILMSATLNASKFASYFDRCSRDPPIISIPGRTFSVQQHYLEQVIDQTKYTVQIGSEFAKKKGDLDKSIFDGTLSGVDLTKKIIRDDTVNSQLIERLVSHVNETFDDQGAVLVFLPGVADIGTLVDRLSRDKSLLPMPLHANLSSQEQGRVFRPAPRGQRKVICSTNVAETSITVDDVVVVIDTCRAKEAGYDVMNGAATLTEVFVSKANCRQRSGRAGRVRPGVSFRLVREKTFEKKLKDEQLPEICRTPLERLVLTAIASGFQDPRRLLGEAVDPPPSEAVDSALETLMGLGAMTYDGPSGVFSLTGLGHHLAAFPIDVRLGKLLVLGSIFSCIDPILTVAAAANEKPMFFSPPDRREEARKAKQQFGWGRSDLLTQAKAFDAWRVSRETRGSSDHDFCNQNFMSRRTLLAISDSRRQLALALSDAGFGGAHYGWEQSDDYNRSSGNVKVLKAVILGALYPNVVQIRAPDSQYVQVAGGVVAKDNDDPRNVKYFTRDKARLFLHPDSINFSEVKYRTNWAAFLTMWKNESKTFVRDSNEVTPGGLLLFGGGEMVVQHEKGLVLLDGWIRLKSKARTAVLARELRQRLDQSLSERYIQPEDRDARDARDAPLLDAFLLLLNEN